MFFVLCFFAFTSLTTVDLFQMERKMVVREVRGEPSASCCVGGGGGCSLECMWACMGWEWSAACGVRTEQHILALACSWRASRHLGLQAAWHVQSPPACKHGADPAAFPTAHPLLCTPACAGGYYRPATYLLAKMVLDALLLRVIPVFIFSAPFYPMVRPLFPCPLRLVCCMPQRRPSMLHGRLGLANPIPSFSPAHANPKSPPPAAAPTLQMGLQSSSAVVATFLFVVSTFAAGPVPCRHIACTLVPGSSAP